jgi:hypothetical protein
VQWFKSDQPSPLDPSIVGWRRLIFKVGWLIDLACLLGGQIDQPRPPGSHAEGQTHE